MNDCCLEAVEETEKRMRQRYCALRYAHVLPLIREVAREQGYAIGVHGSLLRDLDLIAVPWVEWAKTGEVLARTICAALEGVIVNDEKADPNDWTRRNPQPKPLGRVGWSIQLGAGLYVDLSVMSPVGTEEAVRLAVEREREDAERTIEDFYRYEFGMRPEAGQLIAKLRAVWQLRARSSPSAPPASEGEGTCSIEAMDGPDSCPNHKHGKPRERRHARPRAGGEALSLRRLRDTEDEGRGRDYIHGSTARCAIRVRSLTPGPSSRSCARNAARPSSRRTDDLLPRGPGPGEGGEGCRAVLRMSRGRSCGSCQDRINATAAALLDFRQAGLDEQWRIAQERMDKLVSRAKAAESALREATERKGSLRIALQRIVDCYDVDGDCVRAGDLQCARDALRSAPASQKVNGFVDGDPSRYGERCPDGCEQVGEHVHVPPSAKG